MRFPFSCFLWSGKLNTHIQGDQAVPYERTFRKRSKSRASGLDFSYWVVRDSLVGNCCASLGDEM